RRRQPQRPSAAVPLRLPRRRRSPADEQTQVAPQLQVDLPDLAARRRLRSAAGTTAGRRPGAWPRRRPRTGSALVTLVASLVLFGATVLFTGGSVPVAATRAVLPFAVESHPGKGLDVSRTWVLDGERGERLHGELIVVSRSPQPVRFEEIFPTSLVDRITSVRFTPRPSGLDSERPVASYSVVNPGSTVLSYDIAVAAGPVTVQRLQRWAAAQQQAAHAFYAATSAKPPVLLAEVSLRPSVVRLAVDGPPARLRVTGRRTDGSPAQAADLAKAVFTSRDERVVTVSRSGVITPVSAGRSLITVRLGALSASVAVTVSASERESSSSAASSSATPTTTATAVPVPGGAARPAQSAPPSPARPSPARPSPGGTVNPTSEPSPTAEPTQEPTATVSPTVEPSATATESPTQDGVKPVDDDVKPVKPVDDDVKPVKPVKPVDDDEGPGDGNGNGSTTGRGSTASQTPGAG
ncbi:MAG: hypothetical protein M3P91_02055, partial [Actinomycetota bacterium]|nr:hypothetical protein [Actinomycetota bacterium]